MKRFRVRSNGNGGRVNLTPRPRESKVGSGIAAACVSGGPLPRDHGIRGPRLSILRNLFRGVFAGRKVAEPDPEELVSRGWAAWRSGQAAEAEQIADAVINSGALAANT